MTGSKGNSEFCFPETLNAERSIRSRATKLFSFVGEPVVNYFVILPNSMIVTICKKKNYLLHTG